MQRKAERIKIWLLSAAWMNAVPATFASRTAAVSKAGKRQHGMPVSQSSTTTTFIQTNLVSDVPGFARTTDSNLVNPWGMTLGTNSGLWVSDNGSGKATVYDGNGNPIPSGSPLIVSIPARGGGLGAPTGVATNATSGFVIAANGKSAPATELFSTENGTIAGWNSGVDPTHAVITVDNSASGAVYKGLAIGFNP